MSHPFMIPFFGFEFFSIKCWVCIRLRFTISKYVLTFNYNNFFEHTFFTSQLLITPKYFLCKHLNTCGVSVCRNMSFRKKKKKRFCTRKKKTSHANYSVFITNHDGLKSHPTSFCFFENRLLLLYLNFHYFLHPKILFFVLCSLLLITFH